MSAAPVAGAERVLAGNEEVSLLTQSFTDTGNGARFVTKNLDVARDCYPVKAWLIWDGQIWLRDETEQARDLAKRVVVQFYQQALAEKRPDAERFARVSLDSGRLTNMLREAQGNLAITPDKLDQHPDLLVFINGTVDLRTGELGPHDPKHFITRLVRFEYRPGADCPLFLATLDRLMGGGDRAERLIDALQVLFGYSLTGWTREKVVFIFYGSGNNGKTTILALFLKLLEECGVLLQIDSLMVKHETNNSQADLADLRGARFVMTSETEEGQRLAEGKLKRITQGMGKIKATRKYENPITFSETHKLFVDANHRPVIRGTDPAIWNRLFCVPFTVTVPDAEIDRELPEKLLAEAEGILAWAVAGAAHWHREGLRRPAEVTEAVRVYREEMDQIGRFIAAECVTGSSFQASARELFARYRHWAGESGEEIMTSNMFGRKLVEHEGISREKVGGDIRYLGIGLSPTNCTPSPGGPAPDIMNEPVEVDPEADAEEFFSQVAQDDSRMK
jgi:putative DNA primase/helicase